MKKRKKPKKREVFNEVVNIFKCFQDVKELQDPKRLLVWPPGFPRMTEGRYGAVVEFAVEWTCVWKSTETTTWWQSFLSWDFFF